MKYCNSCNNILCTLTEQNINLCVSCAALLFKENKRLIDELQHIKEDLNNIIKKENETKEKLNKRYELDQAEVIGRQACINKSDINENPYNSKSEEYIFWNKGWLQANLKNDFNKLIAIMVPILSYLDHLEELSKGYGQTEIANKINQLIEKISPYLKNIENK